MLLLLLFCTMASRCTEEAVKKASVVTQFHMPSMQSTMEMGGKEDQVKSFVFTCPQVGMLTGRVLALVDPLAIALEEDLQGGPGLAVQLDGVALDDVRIHRLLHEARQRAGWTVLLALTANACAAIKSNHSQTRRKHFARHRITQTLLTHGLSNCLRVVNW